MKYRPSKRVVWLALPLVPVVLMSGLLWWAGQPDSEAIATRGAHAPAEKKFSLANPGSWGVSAEWFGDGMDALMEWEYNPWKEKWKRDRSFGRRMGDLSISGRPEDKAEVERLMKLGREWYERILARYPDLAMPPAKEIPREKNGFLQWQEFMDRARKSGKVGIFDTEMPMEFANHLRTHNEPDMAQLKAWLDANRASIDEIRAIALLPDRSAAGMTEEALLQATNTWARNAADALLLDARAAMADGDVARALESIRAVNGLADHVSENGHPTLISTLMAYSMRTRAQNYAVQALLPSVSSGTVDLSAWQAALNPTLRNPSEMAETLRGEWNMGMPRHLLPVLADTADPGTPRDGDYLAETYTRHMEALVRQADGVSLRDYAASSKVETSVEHLSRRSRELGLVNQWDLRNIFVRNQESTGLTLAAFAILNGQSVPVDPVYGLPYKWDPVKRELALPDLPNGRNYKTKPVKVPKM
ncbi:MAG: hypothetical protein EOP88_05920 [Verrucomicrobiaceae bacterium]|nr:MAG: hypothetical protein EOP88_05920 [Verrucomicrobiaceae bacterium]